MTPIKVITALIYSFAKRIRTATDDETVLEIVQELVDALVQAGLEEK